MGYIVAIAMGVVDFSALQGTSIIALPRLMPFKPEFNLNAIISVTLIFLVSATETIGDTSALAASVLGGCTLMMFGNIVVSGLQMIGKCGYTQRNITIAALSLSIGIGFTQVPEIFSIFPQIVENVFAFSGGSKEALGIIKV